MDRVGNKFITTIAIARNTEQQVVKASGAVAVAGTYYAPTNGIDVADYTEGLLFIDITALTAVTTLDFDVETYDGAKWYDLGVTIDQQTATGQVLVPLTNFGEKIRLKYVVGGAAHTATFSAKFIGKS